MTRSTHTILVAHPSRLVIELVRAGLGESDLHLVSSLAANGVGSVKPDLVLVGDPETDADALVLQSRRLFPGVPVLVLLDAPDDHAALRAIAAGADDAVAPTSGDTTPVARAAHRALARAVGGAPELGTQTAELPLLQDQRDPLTGLINRYRFRALLEKAMRQAAARNRPLALLFIDLDEFKVVNDALGHEVGDALLRWAAHRLSNRLRDDDLVARLGGDEFAVMVRRFDTAGDLRRIAERLMASLEPPFNLDDNEVYVTASIGIAVSPQGGETPSALMRAADIALYRSKENGRNQLSFYSQGMQASVTRRVRLENALRFAQARREFTLHFQPLVAVANRRIAGFEALLRWNNDELGAISPMEFVPVLESTGLILEVGRWVLDTACRQLLAWQQAFGRTDLYMAVNVSPRQLRAGHFVDDVRLALRRSGVSAERLELEVTENMFMEDPDRCVATLQRLDSLGVRLALDDFGTGYSSLEYVKRLSLDRLKIDRTFISGIPADEGDLAIVEATVAIAASFNMAVTAEGVENPIQLDQIARLGCSTAQGYYFGRPVSADEATELLAADSASLAEDDDGLGQTG